MALQIPFNSERVGMLNEAYVKIMGFSGTSNDYVYVNISIYKDNATRRKDEGLFIEKMTVIVTPEFPSLNILQSLYKGLKQQPAWTGSLDV